MSLYCCKCKARTEDIDPDVVRTRNGKLRKVAQCKGCGKGKSCFAREFEGGALTEEEKLKFKEGYEKMKALRQEIMELEGLLAQNSDELDKLYSADRLDPNPDQQVAENRGQWLGDHDAHHGDHQDDCDH